MKTISILSLLSFLFTFVVSEPLIAVSGIVSKNKEAGELIAKLDEFKIPANAGCISGGQYYNNDKLIIYVQDLHCHPEVQKNISTIIGLFDDKYGITKIFSEGAPAGRVDISLIGSMPDKKLRNKMLENLLAKGLMGGAEFYAIYNDKDKLYGIEDWNVYEENLARIRSLIELKETYSVYVNNLNVQLNGIKEKYLSREVGKLEKVIALKDDGGDNKKTAARYLKLVKLGTKYGEDLKSYPNLECFIKSITLGRQIKYKRLDREIGSYISDLKKIIPFSVYQALIKKLETPDNHQEYYLALSEIAKTYSPALLEQYPNLNCFLSYINLNASINPMSMIAEEDAYCRAVLSKSSKRIIDKELVFLSEMGRILANAVNLNITPRDYEFFLSNTDNFKLILQKYLSYDEVSQAIELLTDSQISDFFAANVQRNKIFVDNITAGEFPDPKTQNNSFHDYRKITECLDSFKEIDIVVAGGFHEGLANTLSSKNISYLTITPNVTKAFDPAIYNKIITGKTDFGFILKSGFKEALVSVGIAKGMDMGLANTSANIIVNGLIEALSAEGRISAEIINDKINEWKTSSTDTSLISILSEIKAENISGALNIRVGTQYFPIAKDSVMSKFSRSLIPLLRGGWRSQTGWMIFHDNKSSTPSRFARHPSRGELTTKVRKIFYATKSSWINNNKAVLFTLAGIAAEALYMMFHGASHYSGGSLLFMPVLSTFSQPTNSNNNHEAIKVTAGLIEILKQHHPEAEVDVVNKAYKLAKNYYGNDAFSEKETYLQHCLDVAEDVARNSGDENTIAAALLHKLKTEHIKDIFSKQGLSKNKLADKENAAIIKNRTEKLIQCSKLPYFDGEYFMDIKGPKTVQNYMNLIIQLAGDHQTMLLFFADKLRTLVSTDDKIKESHFQEIQQIYVPIAMRLNAMDIADNLRNEAFRLKDELNYYRIRIKRASLLGKPHMSELSAALERLTAIGESLDDEKNAVEFLNTNKTNIEEALKIIEDKAEDDLNSLDMLIGTALTDAGITDFRIDTRIKSPYSIWEKINSNRRQKYSAMESLEDIYAMRVISGKNKQNDDIIANVAKTLDNEKYSIIRDKSSTEISNGFNRYKFNFTNKFGITSEFVVTSVGDIDKAVLGLVVEDSLKIANPQWIYKAGKQIKEENGGFNVEMQFALANSDTIMREPQNFVPDNIYMTSDFVENFDKLKLSLNNTIYTIVVSDGKNGKTFSVIDLPEVSYPIDAAAHSDINKLNFSYRGFNRLFLSKSSTKRITSEDDTKKQTELKSNHRLLNGDIISFRPQNSKFSLDPEFIGTKRAQLMFKILNDPSEKGIKRNKGIPGLNFNIDKSSTPKLKYYAALCGLSTVDELFKAINYGIIRESGINDFMKPGKDRVINVIAANELGALNLITQFLTDCKISIEKSQIDDFNYTSDFKEVNLTVNGGENISNSNLKKRLIDIKDGGIILEASVTNVTELHKISSIAELLKANNISSSKYSGVITRPQTKEYAKNTQPNNVNVYMRASKTLHVIIQDKNIMHQDTKFLGSIVVEAEGTGLSVDLFYRRNKDIMEIMYYIPRDSARHGSGIETINIDEVFPVISKSVIEKLINEINNKGKLSIELERLGYKGNCIALASGSVEGNKIVSDLLKDPVLGKNITHFIPAPSPDTKYMETFDSNLNTNFEQAG